MSTAAQKPTTPTPNDPDLPEGWAEVAIRDVCEVNPPKPRQDELPADAEVSFVPMPAVDADSGAITHPQVRRFGEVRKGFTSFREGDVIMAKITPCMENGKAAIARGLRSGLGFGSTEFHVLRSNGAVLPEYVFRYIRQESFRSAAEMEMTGSVGQKRVPAQFVQDARIPLPPLAEQLRIIAKLDELSSHLNAARERLARVSPILRVLRQAILAAACSGKLTEDWRETNPSVEPATVMMARFLGPNQLAFFDGKPTSSAGKARAGRAKSEGVRGYEASELDLDQLPELPESWEYHRADAVVARGTGISYGIVLPGPQVEGGAPYIRGQDIENGRILVDQLLRTAPEIAAKHGRSALAEGDVLLCIIRHLKVAVVPAGLDGANLTQGTVRMRPSEVIRGPYLAAYLRSPQAQAWMKRRYFGMDMPRINVEDAREIPIPIAPIEEQEEIVRRVEALFRLAAAIEGRVAAAASRADKLTQSILDRAFRGELVPTEAELARREGRDYEPASTLLDRIRRPSAGDQLELFAGSPKRGRRRRT